jgi:hypothetical protein
MEFDGIASYTVVPLIDEKDSQRIEHFPVGTRKSYEIT